MDVFFYEAFKEEQAAIERCLRGRFQAGFTWRAIQETAHTEPPAGIVSIRTQSAIPPSWGSKLKAVLSRSTGCDHLLAWLNEAGQPPVVCGHLPHYCARAVAEQAALLWMALLRRLPQQMRNFRSFHRDGLTGGECRRRRLLVVGVGNIGGEVVELGRALGMEVLGVDIVQRRPDVDYVEIGDGVRRADAIVCCMSLNEGNVDYFNYERLRHAEPGAVFVNVARGEMARAELLLRLLDEGILGGVGLDVHCDEQSLAVALRREEPPRDPEHLAALELASRPNAILTPHNAFNTVEAVAEKARQSVEQIERFMAKGAFEWPVDGTEGPA